MERKRRSASVVADSSSTQEHIDDDDDDDVAATSPKRKESSPVKKANQAWMFQQDKKPEPLRVGRLTVLDEELSQYAVYCQDSARYRKQVICHMCVFDDQKYYSNHFNPADMVPHCSSIHKKLGLQCKDSSCRVRVSTERELTLHTEFCHRLASGWWNNDKYKGRLQRHYKAVEKKTRPF